MTLDKKSTPSLFHSCRADGFRPSAVYFLMHEMSIAQSLIEIIKDEMANNAAVKLKSARLQIGQMSAIVPDALGFCFSVITEGTELDGAELIMDMVPLKGVCRKCAREFEIIDYAFTCPTCGGSEIETLSGHELALTEIEVE